MSSTDGAVLAAVEDVDIDQLPAVRNVGLAAEALRQQADDVRVTDAIDAQTATALLGRIVTARREAEAQRLDLTRPLNGVVAKINAAAKRHTQPLVDAEGTLKAKLLAYQREQQRKADEERARLEAEAARRRQAEAAEHRRVEAIARAEREAAARAAAQADAAARHAREQDRAAALAAAAEARAREAAARDAEQQAHEAPSLPVVAPVVAAPAALVGGGAKVATRKRWTYEIIDFSRVPDRFKEIAKGEVRDAIREGARDVPGLRIFQVDDASVTL